MSIIVDLPAIVQVIGNIYVDNSLLDNEEYSFVESDFTEDFHKILFGSIYNLHNMGVEKIDENIIEDYLQQRPEKFGIYKANKGREYLQSVISWVQPNSFSYFYNRMKKISLLRAYNQLLGMNVAWLYDVDNILDIKKKQRQEEWLDNITCQGIIDIIEEKIESIKNSTSNDLMSATHKASENITELLKNFEEEPDIGLPLFGDFWATINKGARIKKFYLRSAATNVGKSRTMIADFCYIGAKEWYNPEIKQWERRPCQPSLYITTEQELSEVQTMMLSFIADVEEDKIRDGKFDSDERERLIKAAEIIQESPLYVAELFDFSLDDIENIIRLNIRKNDVIYVFLDYIHSSIKMLSEIASKAKVSNLREDSILFILSASIKKICNKYSVFIESATQLNSNYQNADVYDQNLLRGAKSIGDWTNFIKMLFIVFVLD